MDESYLVALVVSGRVLNDSFMNSFTTGYYPYVFKI